MGALSDDSGAIRATSTEHMKIIWLVLSAALREPKLASSSRNKHCFPIPSSKRATPNARIILWIAPCTKKIFLGDAHLERAGSRSWHGISGESRSLVHPVFPVYHTHSSRIASPKSETCNERRRNRVAHYNVFLDTVSNGDTRLMVCK